MTTANKIIQIAEKYLGYSEARGKHKIIIDAYNAHKPLAQGYKVKYTDDWCDTFVSKVAIEAGAVDLIGTECGVQRHIDIFKSKGIWNEDGRITPKAGDIITFNWNDRTQGNNGWADHIGFVTGVSNGYVQTIEGNYGRTVKRRSIKVGNGMIRGYARPKYGKASAKPTKVEPKPSKKPLGGTAIFQKWLNSNYNTKLSVDNSFGPLTKKAAIKALQTEMNRQYHKKLAVDGSYGPASKRATLSVKRGARGNITRTIQGLLISKGYTVNGFDGMFGPGLEAAVKRFQKAHRLHVDGIVGVNTFTALVK